MTDATVAFLKKLLDPEVYGFSVTAEIRDEARKLLGMPTVETPCVKCGSMTNICGND
jgi:hypothetical protein